MEKYTPMMQQYLKIKEQHKDALLFFRLGDFYEMFFEDAEVAAKELDLVLTSRSGGNGLKVPMAGVPHHASDSYIQRLTQKGYKIAIAEQLEDPSETKGMVDRGVVKIVTPGTIMDELSDNSDSIFLAAVSDYGYGYSVAICEMASGKIIMSSVEKDSLKLSEKLLSDNIREVVVDESVDDKTIDLIKQLPHVLVSQELNIQDLEAYRHLYEELDDLYHQRCMKLLLTYLNNTQMKVLNHLRPVVLESEQSFLKMDYASIANLELLDSLKQSGTKMSLWQFLNHTKTALGSRLLKQWISKPLVKKDKIFERQERITIIKDDFLLRDTLKEKLVSIYDLERLGAKFAYGNANPLDAIRLKQSLSVIPDIFEALYHYPEFESLVSTDDGQSLYQFLEAAIVEEPPVSVRDGGIFKDGYHDQLDELRVVQRDGQKWILELEAKEREKTGVNNLKVGYNRVFGYFYEVTKANFGKIKEEDGYVRKQTLTNAERFITEELKEHESIVLNADESVNKLEQELFAQVVEDVVSHLSLIIELANVIAEIDVLFALGTVATKTGYTRPILSDSREFDITEGRHPILDELMRDERYVSNSLSMSEEDLWVITGPNMGGKSTFMRQCALIVIMAQIGSYVPAEACTIPVFDQIFTRIGASDDILSGQSTFMVEMHEANNALQNATENSLIIFDEIGRGTSTYDGMSLARAMIEYIAENIKAKTLFSTHYHELTDLVDSFDNIRNYHVEVHEDDGHVTFLYRMIPGQADKSYGINVARLADLPDSVIDRAEQILIGLEDHQDVVTQGYKVKEIEVVPKQYQEVDDVLNAVNANELTPMEALQLVFDLKKKLERN